MSAQLAIAMSARTHSVATHGGLLLAYYAQPPPVKRGRPPVPIRRGRLDVFRLTIEAAGSSLPAAAGLGAAADSTVWRDTDFAVGGGGASTLTEAAHLTSGALQVFPTDPDSGLPRSGADVAHLILDEPGNRCLSTAVAFACVRRRRRELRAVTLRRAGAVAGARSRADRGSAGFFYRQARAGQAVGLARGRASQCRGP